MKRRARYLASATRVGWAGLRHPVENVTLALGVAALFGVPTTIGVLQGAGIAGIVVGLLVALAAVVFEGAYHLWHRTDERDKVADTIYNACSTWIAEVEKFLEVREASRPEPPKRDLAKQIARIQMGQQAPPRPLSPQVVALEKEVEAHDRETVALYIEKHRGRGLRLYDALVSLGVLNEIKADRENVRSPKSKHQISSGIFTIRLGAESDLRRYF